MNQSAEGLKKGNPAGKLQPVRPASRKRNPRPVEHRVNPDAIVRAPAGGGYRVLRRPRLLDGEG